MDVATFSVLKTQSSFYHNSINNFQFIINLEIIPIVYLYRKIGAKLLYNFLINYMWQPFLHFEFLKLLYLLLLLTPHSLNFQVIFNLKIFLYEVRW